MSNDRCVTFTPFFREITKCKPFTTLMPKDLDLMLLPIIDKKKREACRLNGIHKLWFTLGDLTKKWGKSNTSVITHLCHSFREQTHHRCQPPEGCKFVFEGDKNNRFDLLFHFQKGAVEKAGPRGGGGPV